MRRRPLALVLTAALIGAVFTALPAKAATELPAEPNIVDVFGDANYVNDQGAEGTGITGVATAPGDGDHATGQDAASVSDLGAVWFTNDAETISVYIQTELPHADNTLPLFYRVMADVGEGTNCLWFQAATDAATGAATLRDTCTTAVATSDGEFALEEGPDGTGIVHLTFPLSAHPALAVGNVLKTPNAHSRNSVPGAVSAPQPDNTKKGADYTITAGDGTEEPPVVEEPEAPKPAKDPCKKLKGKKKKKCIKKNKAKGCAAFTPGEQGADAETVVVKDENTAEAPLEVTVTQEPGMGNDQGVGQYDGVVHQFRNVQVDAIAAEAGLYIRYEFPVYEDHDIYVNYSDGTEAAHAGGFNQAPEGPFDGTGAGGHSEQGAEQIDGLRTADCAGYTVDLANFIGEGGDYTVKLWLGEIQNDPAAPAAKAYVL
jgi:hypothetical protein